MHLALGNHFKCKIQKIFDSLIQCCHCYSIEYIIRFFGVGNKLIDQMEVGSHSGHGVEIHLKMA